MYDAINVGIYWDDNLGTSARTSEQIENVEEYTIPFSISTKMETKHDECGHGAIPQRGNVHQKI